MKQSIVLFIFALLCLFKISTAGPGGAYDYSGDVDEAYLSTISCGNNGQEITFSINIPDIEQWDMSYASEWELTDSGAGSVCQPQNFDNDVEYGPFNAEQCAKEITTDESNNIMAVVFEVSVDPADGEVTFQYDHHYEITCRYSTINSNLVASFVPLHSVASDGGGDGDLTFSFNLYFANGDGLVTTDYTIDLETDLYGTLSVVQGGFSGLDVHFVELTAVSGDGVDSWNLISAGCSQDFDIVQALTCLDVNFEQVTFRAFRFGGQSESALVTFFVTAIVCLPDDINSVCSIDCSFCASDGELERRKRRSLDVDRAVKTKYYLEVGPYKFGNVNKKNQKGADDLDEGDSSTFPTYLIAVLVVSGVVAIAIVSAAVVIVLRKRRRNATLSESSGNSESGTGPV